MDLASKSVAMLQLVEDRSRIGWSGARDAWGMWQPNAERLGRVRVRVIGRSGRSGKRYASSQDF